MAKTKQTNFKEMNDTDLMNRVQEFSVELVAARQKVRLGQFKKTSDLGRLRKEIARIRTELRKREIASVKG